MTKKVLIKIYSNDLAKRPEIAKKFAEKAKIIKELNHPNVAPILEYIQTDEITAIIVDFIEGQNLKFAVSMKDFTKNQNLKFFKHILSGVNYGHQMGLVHRDLRPSNIFFTDNYQTVKILDFGLANIFEYDNPKKIKIGSPMFLSPEQVQEKKTGIYSDIYTLGVILYYMMSHKSPYLNTTSYNDICEKIISQEIPILPRYSKLNIIIKKATSKNHEQRYQSCEEFIDAIENSENE